MTEPSVLPLELTAPLVQRLARKGLTQPLDGAECRHLCECVLFHVESMLERRRVPRVEPDAGGRDRGAEHGP